LNDAVRRLDHGRQRSAGAGEVYRQVRHGISRRDFGELVETVRRPLWREHDANLQRVQWLVAGSVWSIDPTEWMIPGPDGPDRLRLLPVLDLASRFKFAPWVGESITGPVVADHLEELFHRYGAPLVLKRDNGSNLNDEAVNELLGRWRVIALNSPPHYPRYNGAIERAQRELKAAFLTRWLEINPHTCPASAVAAWTVYDLNRQPRRCLRRQSAAAIFCGAQTNLGAYTERRRKEAFDTINGWIMNAVAQREACSQPQLDAAGRHVVETWLQREGLVTLTKPQCVTQFL
jgi:transposase InsO family protein